MEEVTVVKTFDGMFAFIGPHLFPVISNGIGDYTTTPPNCIAFNVKLMSSGNYVFNISGDSDVEYETSYQWALVVINEVNVIRLHHYQELRKLSNEIKRLTESAFDKIDKIE